MEEKLAIQKDVDASKVELVAHLRAKELAELLERQKLESNLEEANDKCTELVQRIDAVSAECEQLRTLLVRLGKFVFSECKLILFISENQRVLVPDRKGTSGCYN